jgi:hypothetical protein
MESTKKYYKKLLIGKIGSRQHSGYLEYGLLPERNNNGEFKQI